MQKHYKRKYPESLTLNTKIKVTAEIERQLPWEQQTCIKNKFEQGSISNWCDAYSDADSSKTICRPPLND